MQERGGGSIVTMSSSAGRLPSNLHPGAPDLGNPWGAPVAYDAAKAGVQALTKHVAAEVAAHGVRVNCVAPASVRIERTAEWMSPELIEAVAKLHPLGRIGEVSDVAAVALFLASAQSSWLTGLTMDVAGGRTML